MQLSVIILNYNVANFLEHCIKSVQAAIADIDAEIIVVDNNSSDDSCTRVSSLFPEITLLDNKENVGFAKANNQGVALAEGEYVCILNPDTVVTEDTFTTLLEYIKTKDNPGIIGCRLVDGTGKYLPESKRNVPTPSISLKKMLGNDKEYYANHIPESGEGAVAVLVGAFMFMKKKVYEEVQGFDESYFMYGEDIDLSYTVTKAGYTNYYFGATTVIHYKGESTLKNKTYAKRFYGAMQIFYHKHFKKNRLFDILVAVGIKLIPLLKKKSIPKQEIREQVVFVSDNIEHYEQIKLKYQPIPVSLQKEVPDSVSKNTEIILDAAYNSYAQIVERIANTGSNGATYKILPQNSQFLIGSNSSESRGEVISLG